jgi:hypothetical protein
LKKKCFLISPIGSEDSEIRDRADMFREDIVRAGIGDRYEVRRADDYNRAGNITSQVIEAIVDADLIVADLTGRNANVYYELSVAHCYRRHVVPMRNVADDTGDLPFDNYTERTIPYSLTRLGLRDRARDLLAKAVEETVGQTPSNPVTTALGLKRVVEQGGDNVATILTSLSAQVATLDRRLSEQERDALMSFNADALRDAGEISSAKQVFLRRALSRRGVKDGAFVFDYDAETEPLRKTPRTK